MVLRDGFIGVIQQGLEDVLELNTIILQVTEPCAPGRQSTARDMFNITLQELLRRGPGKRFGIGMHKGLNQLGGKTAELRLENNSLF